jgi:hypothetical protein
MRDWLFAFWEPFERGSVGKECVEPTVGIDVEDGDAGACRLEEVAVRALAAINGHVIDPGSA